MGNYVTDHSYLVEVQPDFLARQCQAKPVQAVAELIWNGLDADATRVEVELVRGELGMTKVVVRDNGVHDTERNLFYVAFTRARDRLLVSGVQPASEFFADFSTKKI